MKTTILTLVLMGAFSQFAVSNDCAYWYQMVGAGNDVYHTADETDPVSVMEGIECLLKLEGNQKRGSLRGVTSYEISAELPEQTIEVCALYYISYLYFQDWKHAGGIALRGLGDLSDRSDKEVAAIAFQSYKEWFDRVQELGLIEARKAEIKPLEGTCITWFSAKKSTESKEILEGCWKNPKQEGPNIAWLNPVSYPLDLSSDNFNSLQIREDKSGRQGRGSLGTNFYADWQRTRKTELSR